MRDQECGEALIDFEATLSKESYIRIAFTLNIRHRVFLIFIPIFMLVAIDIYLTASFLFLAFWVSFPIILFLIFYIQLVFITSAPGNRKTFEPIRWTFRKNGVVIGSECKHGETAWDAFVSWRKIADHYLLYTSKQVFHAIPESAIPVADKATFEFWLNGKIGKEKPI